MEKVILHAGDIHGHDKIEGMKRLGCWNASTWTRETGEELIKEVSEGQPAEGLAASFIHQA